MTTSFASVKITRDSLISRTKAWEILNGRDLLDLYDDECCYWLGWDAENREFLLAVDDILAENRSTMSWL